MSLVDLALFMAIHKLVVNPGIYYLTFTCYHWLPLIECTSSYQVIYKWFSILTLKGHAVLGYIIMPNHVHMVLYFAGGTQSLNTIVGNGKRFIGYEIIKRLTNKEQKFILKKLRVAVNVKDEARGKKHELWEDSFDIKECRTEKFILQKLNYIHNNPCSGKWKLVKDPYQYQHSSALFYFNGKPGEFLVKDYQEFLWIYQDK
jgi:hypothetical protein